MSKDIRISIIGDDKLSPVAKKIQEKIEDLKKQAKGADEEIISLKNSIRELSSAKGSAKKGLFNTDIIQSKELKSELDKLIIDYKRLKNEKSAQSKDQLKNTSARIEKIYTQEINKQRMAIDRLMMKKRELNSLRQKGIKRLNEETKSLKKVNITRESASNRIVRHIRRLESYVVALYALKKAYDVTLGAGMNYNILLENEKRGLAAVYMSKLKDIDITGRHITAIEKWNISQKMANETFKKLLEINKQTPHDLGQTIQIYRVLAGTSLQYGISQEKLIKLTKLISIASASMGVQFQPLLASIDGLANGTVKANSDLGKMLTSLGLTNETIKEAAKTGTQFDLIISKLKTFAIAGKQVQGEWAGIISNLRTQWNILWGDLQKPLFKEIEKGLQEFTTYLQNNMPKVEKNIKETISYIGEIAKFYIAFKAGGIAYGAMENIIKFAKEYKKIQESILVLIKAETVLDLTKAALSRKIVSIAAGGAVFYEANKLIDKYLYGVKEVSKSENNTKLDQLNKQLELYERNLKNIQLQIERSKGNKTVEDYLKIQSKDTIDKIKELKKEIASLPAEITIVKKAWKGFLDPREMYGSMPHQVDFKTRSSEELTQAKKLLQSSYSAGISGEYEKLVQRYNKYKSQFKDSIEAQKILLKWYNKELDKLNAKAISSYKSQQSIQKYDLNPFHIHSDMKGYKEQLNKQKQALMEYYQAIGAYSSEWAMKESDLRSKYAGLLPPDEIDAIVQKYKTDFFKPINNLSKQTTDSMKKMWESVGQTMQNSMSNFFDYASKGFLNFGSLAESVLHEVYMQIVRMQIVAPLTKGIMGGLTSFFSPSNVAPNLALSLKGYATGGVFTNSIVKEPTYFAYGDTFGSSLGVMGEAGAEAIMPLTRVGGDLGVKAQPSPVVLNITNNSGQDIDAKMVSEMTKTNERGEQERVINIVIDGVNRNVNGIRDALRVAR